jgi:prepilin-type N-terminal cleavage/methylation domain-containing protein
MQFPKLPSRRPDGLTLIELIVVVAILGALAAVVIPITTTTLLKGESSATRSEMASLGKILREHARDVGYRPVRVRWGGFPPESPGQGAYGTVLGLDLEEDLAGLGWDPVVGRGWNGPYIAGDIFRVDADGDGTEEEVRSYQVDSWNRYYIYRNRDQDGGSVGHGDSLRIVTLLSGGPDRDPGTVADNIEVTVFRGSIY